MRPALAHSILKHRFNQFYFYIFYIRILINLWIYQSSLTTIYKHFIAHWAMGRHIVDIFINSVCWMFAPPIYSIPQIPK